MSYSASQANSDLLAVSHGITVNQIPNLASLHNRTARKLIADIDPIETVRKVLSVAPFFYQVWDYNCPADLKGNRIIDISPQFYRDPGQIIYQTFNQPFDVDKNYTYPPSEFTILWNNQVKTIRVNDTTLPGGVVLDQLDAIGNWTAGNQASGLVVDNVNYASGSGSLEFNIAAGGNNTTGSISETAPAPFDLTTQLNQATLFLYVYFPVGANINSVTIQFGSDASDYYQVTATQTFSNTAFATGWNLIGFPWLGATVVGTPIVSKIQYLYIGVQTNGTATTGIRVDNFVSTMGLYRTIEYYSKYLFRNATTGVFTETIQDTTNYSDLINLDTDSYNLYFNLLAYYAAQQMQGLDALFYDANFFLQEYTKDVAKYQARQPSQVQKSRQPYYTPTKGGYGKYVSRRNNF